MGAALQTNRLMSTRSLWNEKACLVFTSTCYIKFTCVAVASDVGTVVRDVLLGGDPACSGIDQSIVSGLIRG